MNAYSKDLWQEPQPFHCEVALEAKWAYEKTASCGGGGARRMSKSCLEGDSRPRDCCERLVFVGGMGTADTSLHLLCACSLKGERARCYSVRRNRGPNTMLL